ncbi:hypothetical protein BEP19_03065 [Ammoniphilus oxalaticus]|uniref:Phospholipase/carboxylesterase/thioesterase domain-containing protein n=1 Tax=Ammoniphilus oxalaticus TaxID=66863 RepID=A0A419SNP1_9BACL|nr:dienelactone hydrolase family protein [Ammoniphilus oxalaticus]RKD25924.1 hypothetical protein BEP19_03065 [Ammoniphilus oxalaticus]
MKSPLEYTVLQPANAQPDKKYPVIFVMHGRGANEHDLLPLVEELQNDFIIFGIRGDVPEGPGFAYFTNISHGNPDRASFDRCIEKLQGVIDYAAKTYPIDTNYQYLLGFSQGAILSMSLAVAMGNKIKGIVSMNGYIPTFVKEDYPAVPGENVSIYLSHGEVDHVYPLEHGLDNKQFFEGRGNKAHFSSYPVGHGITPGNRDEFVKWLYDDVAAK